MRTHIKPLLSLLLLLAVATPTLHAQITEVDWQQKAVQQFPQIAVAGSPENVKFLAKYKELKDGNSPLLHNARWPYIIAQQICVQVIPGLSAIESGTPTPVPASVSVPAPAAASTPLPTPKPSPTPFVFDTSTVWKATDAILKDIRARGKMVSVTGSVTKTEVAPLDNSKFYVYLDNAVVCEFDSATFIGRSIRALGYHQDADQLRLEFNDDTVSLIHDKPSFYKHRAGMVPEGPSHPENQNFGPVFPVGKVISVKGHNDGLNSDQLHPGLFLSDCEVIDPKW